MCVCLDLSHFSGRLPDKVIELFFLSVLARFGLVSVLSSSVSSSSIKSHDFLLLHSEAKKGEKKLREKMAKVDPFDMTDKEREIIQEITTTECGEDCLHCEHTEACDSELHFRTRYCGSCRMHMFHRMQEWRSDEFAEKSKKIEKEGTQEFMETGRMFFTNPASYEYVHVNTNTNLPVTTRNSMPWLSILQIPIEICHLRN